MRTISQAFLDELGNTRKITGRLTFRDERLLFTARTISEDIAVDSIYQVDHCEFDAGSPDNIGLLQVAKTESATEGDKLAWRWVSDLTALDWGGWTVEDTIDLSATCAPGCEDGRIWYMNDGGDLCYVDFNGSSLDAPVTVQVGLVAAESLPSSIIALAPVSDVLCYIQSGPATSPLTYTVLLSYDSGGDKISEFHGYIYGDVEQAYRFDAVTLDGIDYVFTVDRDDGRTLVLQVEDGVWSDAKHLIPLDVVDTENNFALGGVSVLNSQVLATGRYTRGASVAFDMYTMGSASWTMGRNLFIVTDNIAGKMFEIGDVVYYVGFGKIAEADASYMVGVDLASKKLQTQAIFDANMTFRNGGSNLSMQVQSSLDHAAIRKNASVTVEGAVNGEYGQLGVFGIDVISPSQDESGYDQSIGCRGYATKKLDQWESDQNYDYWSQTKMHTNTADRDEMINVTGFWNRPEGENYLELSNLNVDGFMYSVHRATRGAAMRARFYYPTSPAGSYTPKFGVGVNYYRESKFEAAERLGIDSQEITEDQYGHNGIFAIWGPEEHAGADGIGLYVIRLNTWTKITSAALATPADTWHWLELLFQDGFIRVLYRLDASAAWTEVLSTRYSNANEPWYRTEDDIGRGALYMINETPNSTTPGFSSSSDIIPVADSTVFPSTETVLVDEEQIVYDGTSGDPGVDLGTMTVADGDTFGTAPHDNTVFTDGLLWSIEEIATSGDVNVGKSKDEAPYVGQAWVCTYNYTPTKAAIYVKKVGAPGNLYLYLVHDDFDNYSSPLQSAIQCVATIPAASVGTGYAWVEASFVAPPDLYPENWWLFATTMPEGSIDYATYANDASNYYIVKMDESLSSRYDSEMGIFRLWNETTRWDAWYEAHATDAVMPFKLYGTSVFGEGYEIYIDGADIERARDLFDDMALVVTSGAGQGSVFKITDYDHQAPDQWVPNRSYIAPDNWEKHVNDTVHGAWVTPDMRRIFVDRNPAGMVTEGSTVAIYETLLVDTDVDGNLLRGQNDTVATSHGSGIVSIYRDVSIHTDIANYYSTEIDMRLEDMGREVCAKAGVLDFSCEKLVSGSQVFSEYGTGLGWSAPLWEEKRVNAIVKLSDVLLDTGEEVGLIFRCLTDPDDYTDVTQGYMLTLYNDGANYHLKFYKHDGIDTWDLAEQLALGFSPGGEITVSVLGSHFAVWIANRYVHTFADDSYSTGEYIGVIACGDMSPTVDWSALDQRVDNFILDMGVRGSQFISQLIGRKRVFYQDTQNGGLYMAPLRTDGPADYSVSDLVFQSSASEMDTDIKTFIRSEGAGKDAIDYASEQVDYTKMRDEGFLFGVVSASEANDEWETEQEALAVLKDSESSAEVVSPSAAADPRVEPNDVITVTLPDGATDVVVDRVSFKLATGQDDATFDMGVQARNAL